MASAVEALPSALRRALAVRSAPDALRGRVSSFDWLVSIGLIPVSFAATGPIAAAVGATTTLWVAGALGGAAMLAFLLVPGRRDPERRLAGADPLAVTEVG